MGIILFGRARLYTDGSPKEHPWPLPKRDKLIPGCSLGPGGKLEWWSVLETSECKNQNTKYMDKKWSQSELACEAHYFLSLKGNTSFSSSPRFLKSQAFRRISFGRLVHGWYSGWLNRENVAEVGWIRSMHYLMLQLAKICLNGHATYSQALCLYFPLFPVSKGKLARKMEVHMYSEIIIETGRRGDVKWPLLNTRN